MLIGIDGNEANVGERVGVNVWAFEMLKQFKATSDKRQATSKTAFQIYLSRPPLSDLPQESEHWRYRVTPPALLWTRWRLPLELYLQKYKGSDLFGRSDPFATPDVFLSLSHYAPSFAPMPRVVCIMDLSFLKFPEAFKPQVRWQLTNWTRESVKKAARVITISEFNKKEIVKNYGYPEEKINVVYPGVSEVFKGQAFGTKGLALSKYGIEGKYLLFVGTRQPKKNLGRLIEAFGLVRQRFPKVELVVAGKTWGQFAEDKAEGRRPKDEGITYLGFVREEELPSLYAGAEALVLPSLYEGFGMPAAEAMAVGTPVLASNVTGLPEVVGNAGILFDPYDVKDMADKICRLLAMTKAERQGLAEKGKIRAEMFSWEKAAESILRTVLAVGQGQSSPDENER